MELLVYLSERRGEVISREQLNDAIWPGLVVGNEALNKAIFSLRALLADDAKNPIFIETIPKRGYRWLAEVKTQSESQSRISLFRFRMLGGAAIFGCLVLFTLWLSTEKSELKVQSVEAVLSRPGIEGGYRLNPSGKQALYIHRFEGATKLVVYDHPDGQHKVISPEGWESAVADWVDEDSLIYRRCKGGACDIIRWSGGTEQTLYQSSVYIPSMSRVNRKLSTLYFTEILSPEDVHLKSLNLLTGRLSNLSEDIPSLPRVLGYLSFEEASQRLYFVDYRPDSKPIVALDLKNYSIETISDAFVRISNFTANKNLLIISGQHQQAQGIFAFDLRSHSISTLLMSSNDSSLIVSSMRDDKIYFESSNFKRQSWRVTFSYDENSNAVTTGEASKFSLAENDDYYNLRFNHHGDKVYYVSALNGYHNVWRYDTQTRSNEQITNLQSWHLGAPLISKDESLLAILVESKQAKILIFDLSNNTQLNSLNVVSGTRPLAWDENNERLSLIGPNNQLAYFSISQNRVEPSLENLMDIAQTPDGQTFALDNRGLIHQLNDAKLTALQIQAPGKSNQIFAQDDAVIARTVNPSALYRIGFDTKNGLQKIEKLMDLPENATLSDVGKDSVILEMPQELQGDSYVAKLHE